MLKTVFKNQIVKTVLRTLKTIFKKLTTCSIDFLLFFIEIEIIKANENHINISYENYICFEASGGWAKRQIILICESTLLALSVNKGRFQTLSATS